MRAHFQDFADANARALRSAFLLATRAHMQTQCANAREFPTSFRPPMIKSININNVTVPLLSRETTGIMYHLL